MKVDSILIKGKDIIVLGAGNFFLENQNTVFLKCEEKQELYTIWKAKEEKTYKEFHPHITIYDGNDRLFAKNLFETINSHKINFSFIVDKLELYSSANKTMLFNLKHQVDYLLLSKIAGTSITQENIDKLSSQKRVELIDKLCSILESVNDLLDDPAVSPTNLHEHRLLVEA